MTRRHVSTIDSKDSSDARRDNRKYWDYAIIVTSVIMLAAFIALVISYNCCKNKIICMDCPYTNIITIIGKKTGNKLKKNYCMCHYPLEN